MQGNKENEGTNKPEQNNKANLKYYTNMSAEEFEVFCKRLLTLHRTGVYIPPPPKARVCKNKIRAHRGPREYIQKESKTSITFGKGRVGVSCESFGFKNCLCCLSANEAQPNIRILRSKLQNNTSEAYEQKIKTTLTRNNRTDFINEDVLKINKDKENIEDSFNKYDKKIENFLVKTEMYEKRLQTIVSKYNTSESIEIIDETVLKENSKYDHDYCNKNTIIIDDENSLPSTSFGVNNNSDLELIDEIILSDSDNDDTNTNISETNKISASSGLNLNKKNEPTILPILLECIKSVYSNTKTNETKYNVNQDCPTTSNPIVDQISEPVTSNLEMLNSIRNMEVNESDSNIIIIDDSFTETNNKEPENKSSEKGLSIPNCPICLETLENKEIMSTFCGHIFCSPCITNCIRKTRKCPNCRNTLSLKRIHPIFL